MNTTTTAYAPLNGIPNGIYGFQVYIFTNPVGGSTEISVQLITSNSPISNGQVTNIGSIFGNEQWATSSTIGRFSMSPFFVQDVQSPYSNIALGCRANSTLSGPSIFYLKAVRLG